MIRKITTPIYETGSGKKFKCLLNAYNESMKGIEVEYQDKVHILLHNVKCVRFKDYDERYAKIIIQNSKLLMEILREKDFKIIKLKNKVYELGYDTENETFLKENQNE